MIKSIVKTIGIVFTYLFVGLIPFIPAAIYYFLQGAKSFKYLLRVDIAVCIMAHGVKRTISGLTGERMDKYKRYYYLSLLIDTLAYPFEKEWNHCKRVDRIEQFNLKHHGEYVTNNLI